MLFIWFMVIAVAGIRLMPGHLVAFLSFDLLMVVLLLLICYVKGEPPRWRWGESECVRIDTRASTGETVRVRAATGECAGLSRRPHRQARGGGMHILILPGGADIGSLGPCEVVKLGRPVSH